MDGEISFCELRKKEVVNAADGSRLGHIVDMIISVEHKTALGIVAPGRRSGFFGKEQTVFIPLGCIIKIGEDVILVNISMGAPGEPPPPPPPGSPPPPAGPPHSSGCGSCGLYNN